MAKKKKMTAAQAAAARRDDKPRKRSTTTSTSTKDSGPKNKDNLFTLVIPLIFIALVVVFSIVFTVVPGLVLVG